MIHASTLRIHTLPTERHNTSETVVRTDEWIVESTQIISRNCEDSMTVYSQGSSPVAKVLT